MAAATAAAARASLFRDTRPGGGIRLRQNGLAQSIVKLALVATTALGNALAVPVVESIKAHNETGHAHHAAHDNATLTFADNGVSARRNPEPTGQLVFDGVCIAGLVLGGGLCAGLTLSLMGLDAVNLQVLSSAGSESERKNAKKVLNLIERGRHWVLVVLLLSNVIVNETLPVFLEDFGGYTAVFVSTFLIVIFGEILPQSICARYGLAIGAACAPMVWALMIVLAPVAWPTAKLLDWLLGEDHGTTYKKAELKTFVSLHQQLGAEQLNEDEVTIIRAVLELNDKTVKDVMTPIQDVFVMSADTILDEEGVGKLVQSGYSRVPVHEKGKPDSVMGMLLVKDLITYDPEDSKEVASFQLRPLPEAAPDLTLLATLNYFQTGRSHMLLVSAKPGQPEGAMGVVTLEDVVEELIGEEIIDETDVWVDVHNRVRVTRKPQEGAGGNQGSGGADLGPLVRGIIERRRMGGLKQRGRTAPLRDAQGQMARVHIKRANSPSGTSDYDGSRRPSAALERTATGRQDSLNVTSGGTDRKQPRRANSSADGTVSPYPRVGQLIDHNQEEAGERDRLLDRDQSYDSRPNGRSNGSAK